VPDLTIEYFQICSSWNGLSRQLGSDGKTIYIVSFGGPAAEPYCAKEDGTQCEANKFHNECHHVKNATMSRCLWHEVWAGMKDVIHHDPKHPTWKEQTPWQRENMRCPECRRKTYTVPMAV